MQSKSQVQIPAQIALEESRGYQQPIIIADCKLVLVSFHHTFMYNFNIFGIDIRQYSDPFVTTELSNGNWERNTPPNIEKL